MTPFAARRALRPLFRLTNAFRLISKAALMKGRVSARFDDLADAMVGEKYERYVGDILKVPRANRNIKASEGLFTLHKAAVDVEAFKDLHLPSNLKGGIVEFVHIGLNLQRRSNRLIGLTMVIENVLLVVGPGHYDRESWTYDNVREQKGKLVELLGRRAAAFAPSKTAGKSKATMVSGMKNRMMDSVRNAIYSSVAVDIKNVVIRYEDCATLQKCGYQQYNSVVHMEVNLHLSRGGGRSSGAW